MSSKWTFIFRLIALLFVLVTAIGYMLSWEYAWVFALVALLLMVFFVLPERIKQARKSKRDNS